MKVFIISAILALPFLSIAQTEKGVSPIQSAVGSEQSAVTRAVIIGISDYQEPLIPDLKYADRDADAFATWLRSPAGGNVPEENIFLHTNKSATNAQMILSLDWLIEESTAGDRAFIYFSGHGDVERVTKYNNGYLLGYDSPPAVYGAGAFAVNYLKDIIATLSDNGVQVFLISDACRAGKLAGSNANGTQVTAARMSQQFANEIKILSCQPDEFSIEGEQWGGGRGCFSYHLENALYGFADKNRDAEINLMELGRYLEDNVSAEADPNSQFPMVEGPAKEKITLVDAIAFAEKKEELKNKKTEFLGIDNKGLEEIILAEADTNIQKIYEQFLAAIDSNYLMEPKGKSANDYYDILTANNEIKKLHGTVKRKFVVALMDDGQQIINKVMQTDPQMLDNIYAKRVKYDHLPAYFNRAAEVLGEGHYLYNNIKAKELYFLSKTFRHENYPDSTNTWRELKTKNALSAALQYDSSLVLIYYDKAYVEFFIDYSLGEYVKKISNITEVAPNWTLAHNTLAILLLDHGVRTNDTTNFRKSITHYKKAIRIDSNYLKPYHGLSYPYKNLGKIDSAKYWSKIYLNKIMTELDDDPANALAHDCLIIGHAYYGLNDLQKAKFWFEQAAIKSDEKMAAVYHSLDDLYIDLQEFENAIKANQKLASLTNDSSFISFSGIDYFYFLNDLENADKLLSDEWKTVWYDHYNIYIIDYFYLIGEHDKAIHMIDASYKKYPENYLLFRKAEIIQQTDGLKTARAAYQNLLDSVTIHDSLLYERRFDFLYPNYIYKAIAHYRIGNYTAFNETLNQAHEHCPNEPMVYFDLARTYAMTGQNEMAISSLSKAIGIGWEPEHLTLIVGTLLDPMLHPVREIDEFGALIKKHFPKYYDIATRVPGKN